MDNRAIMAGVIREYVQFAELSVRLSLGLSTLDGAHLDVVESLYGLCSQMVASNRNLLAPLEVTDSAENHARRSEFIRGLVQHPAPVSLDRDRHAPGPPRTIVQYWHDLNDLPADVEECIATWARWTASGFAHFVFDEGSATAFIHASLQPQHERAFERCYHPAMQADYFRLCYVLVKGGFYVDADDVCVGTKIDWLYHDGRLKVQPLCYDIAGKRMVNPSLFTQVGAFSGSWIFYVNNNPLVARAGHPIIERALARATALLLQAEDDAFPEIQETTGPGNLTRSIFEHDVSLGAVGRELVILRDWESVAKSKWPLSYRRDERNWRLSNGRRRGHRQS
jgi:hypothetical protein